MISIYFLILLHENKKLIVRLYTQSIIRLCNWYNWKNKD